MQTPLFAREDVWAGGDFGLAIVISPGNREHVSGAIRELWATAAPDGCYLRGDVEPDEQSRVDAIADENTKLYGVATIRAQAVPCVSYTMRLRTGEHWLYCVTTIGALDALMFRRGAYRR
jgi:hypothetical protein